MSDEQIIITDSFFKVVFAVVAVTGAFVALQTQVSGLVEDVSEVEQLSDTAILIEERQRGFVTSVANINRLLASQQRELELMHEQMRKNSETLKRIEDSHP